MKSFEVDISGMSLFWHGQEDDRRIIKAFLDDAVEYFTKKDIETKTDITFLPM